MLGKPLPYRNFRSTWWLIGINVALYLIMRILPGLYNLLAMNPVLVFHNHFYWTLLTYMYVHGGNAHIFFNMLGLFFFGPPLEEQLGSGEFLIFYHVVGILSGLFSLYFYSVMGWNQLFLMGASGAIYGVLLGFAVFYPRAKVYIMGLIPLRAPLMILLFAGMEMFQQIFASRSGVAHLAHLAGLVVAALYFVIRLGINPLQIFRKQNDI